jgi:hypothetical protein
VLWLGRNLQALINFNLKIFLFYPRFYVHLLQNAEKELILQDLTDLHSTLSQGEFDTKFLIMFSHWLVRSSEFALYFYHQWVQGDFREWQIFRSAPGVASTNNAVESLNANIKKYFTCRKRFKLGKLCCMGLV